jgi:hypothetical protein
MDLTCEVLRDDYACWKCKREVQIIVGIMLSDTAGHMAAFGSVLNDEIANFIAANMPAEVLHKSRIGNLERRFSKSLGKEYISNGCFHCGALFGKHFLLGDFSSAAGEPFYDFTLSHDVNPFKIPNGWSCAGRPIKNIG